jgi:hypothetical protein
MEFKKMLVGPGQYLLCAHVQLYSCRFHWATSGWSLQKRWVTLRMEFTQKPSYPRPASIYKLLFPLGKRRDGLSCDQTCKEVGLPRMESALQTSTCCCFLLGYLWIKPTEKIGYPGWNQDWNRKLLSWMEWASSIDIVIVHFIMIYDHFLILYNAIW